MNNKSISYYCYLCKEWHTFEKPCPLDRMIEMDYSTDYNHVAKLKFNLRNTKPFLETLKNDGDFSKKDIEKITSIIENLQKDALNNKLESTTYEIHKN